MRLFIFILSISVLISACSSEKTAAEYLEAAQTFKTEGKLKAALIESRNAVRLDSDSAISRALSGELELLVGNPSNSEKELLRAIELGTSTSEVSHLLSAAYLRQGKHDELVELEVSDLTPDNAAEVLANQANSYLSQNDLGMAADFAQQAVALNPESLTALTSKARVHALENDFTQAKELLGQALEVSDTHAEAWELMGDIESSELDSGKAVVSYSKAVDSARNKLPALVKRAQSNMLLQDFQMAKEDLDRITGSGVKLPVVSLMNSEILLRDGKFLDAQTELEGGLKLSPDSPELTRSLALTHLMLGNLGQAEQFGKQYQISNNSDDAMLILAAIRLQQGRAEQTVQTLQPLLETNRLAATGLRILATAFLKQGKSDEAITIMSDLHDSFALANAETIPELALLARPSKALAKEWLNVLPPATDDQVDQFLSDENLTLVSALTHSLSGRTIEAEAQVAKLIELSPEHPAIDYLTGRIKIASGDSEAAKASFEASYSKSALSTSSVLILALFDVNEKNYDSAKARLRKNLDNAEGFLRERTLLTLANLEGTQGNIDEMIAWLKQAKSENPGSYVPTVSLANIFLQKENPQEVINTLSSLTTIGKRNPQSMKLMAQALISLKQFEEAKVLVTPLVTQSPGDPDWHYLRAGAFAGLGNIEAARSNLEDALKANPDHAPSLIAKTDLDIRENRLDIAAIQLAQLENLVPGAPALTSISNRLTERSKKNAAENTDAKPESTQEVMQLAKKLWSENKRDEALSKLTDWIDDNPADITILLMLGNTYSSLERHDDSIAMFKSILKVEPDNFIALNNLAWQLRDEDPTTAVSHATAALQLQPDSIATLDTLAVIHYGQGNYSEAEKVFRKIQLLDPTEPTILFHGAKLEVALGNIQAARKILEPLVSGSVEFPEAKEAEALLESL